MDPLTQGATFWAEAGATDVCTKGQNRVGWAHKSIVVKGPWTGSEILSLLGH